MANTKCSASDVLPRRAALPLSTVPLWHIGQNAIQSETESSDRSQSLRCEGFRVYPPVLYCVYIESHAVQRARLSVGAAAG